MNLSFQNCVVVFFTECRDWPGLFTNKEKPYLCEMMWIIFCNILFHSLQLRSCIIFPFNICPSVLSLSVYLILWFLPPLLVFLLVLLTFPPFWILFSFSFICSLSLLLFHVLIFPILFFFIPSLFPVSVSPHAVFLSGNMNLVQQWAWGICVCLIEQMSFFQLNIWAAVQKDCWVSVSWFFFFYSSSVSSYPSQTRVVSGA